MPIETHLVIGYGSLLDRSSLRATAPQSTEAVPVWVPGYRRSFCVFDADGWTSTNLDVAGEAFYAVGVERDLGAATNAVAFLVSEADFRALCRREHQYRVETVEALHFADSRPAGPAKIFVPNHPDPNYLHGGQAQHRYLTVCLNGAAQYGPEFYAAFADTTWVNDCRLTAVLNRLLPTEQSTHPCEDDVITGGG